MKTLITCLLFSCIAFAQQKAKPATIKTKLEPEMVLVQGGTFAMGSDTGANDELSIHKVSIGSFKMGKYEVTQAQWKAVMGTNPSKFKTCASCPVENVSWFDVQKYLKKLNEKTGKKYRLPTEAEWEYAARGGNKSQNYSYSGSNDIEKVSWYKDNSNGKTQPCGTKKPNELGIYDMSGNVREWCSDWYDNVYYAHSKTKNPTGPKSATEKVCRGGSWSSIYEVLTTRGEPEPDTHSDFLGFRIVVSE
jgi:formylglycine-generating enzyme required for sulfatase activity